MTTLTTRPGQGLNATVYADRSLEGYTVVVEIANENDFNPLELTKTPAVAGRVVTFSLSSSEVESIRDSRFRVTATKNAKTVVVDSGHINYLAAKPAVVTTGNIETSLPDRLSDTQLKTNFTSTAQNRHGLRLVDQDGGPAPYSTFQNARSDPYYFPLALWNTWIDGGQTDIDADKAAGINTYLGMANPPACTPYLPLLATSGMSAILDWAAWGSTYSAWKNSPGVIGHVLHDEKDMAGDTPTGAQQGITDLRAQVDAIPRDGRLLFGNFGKGIAFWHSDRYVRSFVNEFADVNSLDVYWMTDADALQVSQGAKLLNGGTRVSTENESRMPYNYQLSFQQMRRNVDPAGSKPLWNFVELGHPGVGGTTFSAITNAEIRAAAWHSIIAGARGLCYFNITFTDPQNYNLVRNVPAIKTYMGTLNGQITKLASVLNGPSVADWLTTSSGVSAATRYQGSNYYIIAGSKQRASQTATFNLSSAFGATQVEVVGESRTLPISAGAFTDTFADKDAVHIYKLVPIT